MFPEPQNQEEIDLVTGMLEVISKKFPDWSLGDRAEFAMDLFAAVKKWAHKNELTQQEERTEPSRIIH